MSFLRVVLLALLAVAFLAWSEVAQAEDVVLVPQSSINGQVPIEIEFPKNKKKQAQAFAKTERLRRMLEKKGLVPQAEGDFTDYDGKCIVVSRQLEIGEATFQIRCWSNPMWSTDRFYVIVGQPESPEEAIGFIKKFLEKHKERLERPRPSGGKSLMT